MDTSRAFFETVLLLNNLAKHYNAITIGDAIEINKDDAMPLFELEKLIGHLRGLYVAAGEPDEISNPVLKEQDECSSEEDECLPEPGEQWTHYFSRYARRHRLLHSDAMKRAGNHWHANRSKCRRPTANEILLEMLPSPTSSDNEDIGFEPTTYDSHVIMSKDTVEYANVRREAEKSNADRQEEVKATPDNWHRWSKQRIPAIERYYLLCSAKGKCTNCKKELTMKTLTIDHLAPKSRTGIPAMWDLRNLTVLCRNCNSKKGVRMACDVGMNCMMIPSIAHPIVREMNGIVEHRVNEIRDACSND